MKALTKKQIKIMLDAWQGSETITKVEMAELFEKLGDDYFRESSYAPFELTKENPMWQYVREMDDTIPRKGAIIWPESPPLAP